LADDDDDDGPGTTDDGRLFINILNSTSFSTSGFFVIQLSKLFGSQNFCLENDSCKKNLKKNYITRQKWNF
jgi:hypothetical protein